MPFSGVENSVCISNRESSSFPFFLDTPKPESVLIFSQVYWTKPLKEASSCLLLQLKTLNLSLNRAQSKQMNDQVTLSCYIFYRI